MERPHILMKMAVIGENKTPLARYNAESGRIIVRLLMQKIEKVWQLPDKYYLVYILKPFVQIVAGWILL